MLRGLYLAADPRALAGGRVDGRDEAQEGHPHHALDVLLALDGVVETSRRMERPMPRIRPTAMAMVTARARPARWGRRHLAMSRMRTLLVLRWRGQRGLLPRPPPGRSA
jgi:hypothetical protein